MAVASAVREATMLSQMALPLSDVTRQEQPDGVKQTRTRLVLPLVPALACPGSGQCIDDPCTFRNCPGGQWCNPNDGQCEDDPCVGPSLFLKKHLPAAGLAMFPKSGHVLNLEEPALFNETVERFVTLDQ